MRGERRPRAFYAAGMLNQGERAFDLDVMRLLDELGYETMRSPGNTELKAYVAAGMSPHEARSRLFKANLDAVDHADLVIVNLDGQVPDEGACIEVGIAYGRGKRCVGVRTSPPEPEDEINPIVDGVLDYEVAHGLTELSNILSAERVIVDLRSTVEEGVIDLRGMETAYVVVSGPLGVGKSSLIDLLARDGGWNVLPEPVMDNPYLSEVYSNLGDYAFRNQAFYLGQRAKLHNEARGQRGALLQERCLSEDAEVFNRVMHELGAIDDNDLETLMTIYRSLIVNVPRPDVVLYLAAPFEVTLERIRVRDRVGESDLDSDFLRMVHERYEEWAAMPKPVPVLRIDTEDYDYVNRPEDAAAIVRRVGELLVDNLVLS